MTEQKRCSDVTGVILAGGKSRRMGRDKATLTLHGQRLFDRSSKMLQSFFPRVVIAGDRPDLAAGGLEYFPDLFPGSALGGLYTGLYYARTPFIFVTACDLPFPDPDLVQTLLDQRLGQDVVVFRTAEGLEPLFALYGQKCLEPMRDMLSRGQYRVFDFFDQVRTLYLELPPTLLHGSSPPALFNVNTPEDFQAATRLGKDPR